MIDIADVTLFLHLHGSALYYSTEDSRIFKNKIFDSLSHDDHHQRNHLVLTQTDLKPDVISRSNILSAYWEFFNISLKKH